MSDVPIEVQLVSDVRTCRTCKWFWGGVPPYGNFPVFDWNEDFPEAIRNQHQTTDPWLPPQDGLKGRALGQGQVDPGIMHGCRKAPIMTIGINPNMTAYRSDDDGARWSYPNFSKDARYAYYYRHHNVYQESLDPEFIRKNVRAGTEIVAEKDGWLVGAERSSDHRWVLLTILYDGEDAPQQIERAWTAELRLVVLVERTRGDDFDEPGFKAGETIAGCIEGLQGDDVQIFENVTGYYQRYVHVLDRFKERAGEPFASADLSISEDVAQHDMVACASPGWSDVYDIPRERITSNCVADHGYLTSQLVQSKPAVIVIVGSSTLEMFLGAFRPYLDADVFEEAAAGEGSPQRVVRETFQLLKETTEREHFLHIKTDDFEMRSRIVVSPHFSYYDNFRTHSRLSATAWEAFVEDFPEDAKFLTEAGLRDDNTWNDYVPIRVSGPDDPVRDDLSSAAWSVLMAYFIDPIEMMANALVQETETGRIAYDKQAKRLRRTSGGCQFCVNDLWEFPEGCAYGKPGEQMPAPGHLEAVVAEISSSAREAATAQSETVSD